MPVRRMVAGVAAAVMVAGGVSVAAAPGASAGSVPVGSPAAVVAGDAAPRAKVPVSVRVKSGGRVLVVRVDWNDGLDDRPGRDRFVVRVMAGTREVALRTWRGSRPDVQIVTIRLTAIEARAFGKARSTGDAVVAVTQQSDTNIDDDTLYERNNATIVRVSATDRLSYRDECGSLSSQMGFSKPHPSMGPSVDGCVDVDPSDCSSVTIAPGVDLSGCSLSGAFLSGADLNGANLTGAYLTGVRLTGANLTGADLTRTVLRHADLGPQPPQLDRVTLNATDLTMMRWDLCDDVGWEPILWVGRELNPRIVAADVVATGPITLPRDAPYVRWSVDGERLMGDCWDWRDLHSADQTVTGMFQG